MDYCVEPEIARDTAAVRNRIAATVGMFRECWARSKDAGIADRLLPVVQGLWVNTQGLFVLGPIVLAFALIDAALVPGAFAPARHRWWRTVGIATGLVALACLANPYGIVGALFPLQLAETMRSPIFSRYIAELTPIPQFIESAGLGNVPLQMHLATLVLGGVSFVLPVLWRAKVRVASPPVQSKRKSAKRPTTPAREETWRLSPFRLLLFAAFSALSWRATRNSHQFAAVVGTVTAWNFGEWAAAMRRRRMARTSRPISG